MSDKKKTSKPNMPEVYSAMGSGQVRKNKKRQEDDMDTWRAALSGQILAKSGPAGAVGDTWLNLLKHDSLQFLEKQSGGRLDKLRQEQLNKQAIEVTVDRLFSCFQGFAYEFNKVAVGTDLHVSGTMSGDVKEVLQVNKYREAEETQSYFRARLSTRLYTLVVRGSEDEIDFFVMPVNHAMALSTLEKEYKPLATIEIKVNDEGIIWRTVTDEPGFESLEELCAWLFQSLIDRTREAMLGRSRD